MSDKTEEKVYLAVYCALILLVVFGVCSIVPMEHERSEVKRQAAARESDSIATIDNLREEIADLRYQRDFLLSLTESEDRSYFRQYLGILSSLKPKPCPEQPVKSDAERESASGGVR